MVTDCYSAYSELKEGLTLTLSLFQSSTSFSVHLSTTVVVWRGEGSLARYGP